MQEILTEDTANSEETEEEAIQNSDENSGILNFYVGIVK